MPNKNAPPKERTKKCIPSSLLLHNLEPLGDEEKEETPFTKVLFPPKDTQMRLCSKNIIARLASFVNW